jgi:protein-S-isoprenylcysteine O-methyltransferase Ste14
VADAPGASTTALPALSLIATLIAVAALIDQLWFNGGVLPTSPLTIAMEVAAIALMLWARTTFGMRSFHAAANPSEGGLVTSGPYHFIRHPIYTAASLFTWGAALAHWSWQSATVAIIVTAAMLVRLFSEEHLLRARYSEYADYMRHTRRMVPWVF